MILSFLSVIAEEILYFSVIDWMMQTSYRQRLGVKVCITLVLAGIQLLLPEVVIGDFIVGSFMIMGALIYLLVISPKIKSRIYLFFLSFAATAVNIAILIPLAAVMAVIFYLLLQIFAVDVSKIGTIITKMVAGIVIYRIAPKVPLHKLMNNKGIVYITGSIAILMLFIEQIGLLLNDRNEDILSSIFFLLLVFLTVLGILWLMDHHRLSERQLKVEQDNSRMNSDLHKTKELMPLLLSLVNKDHDVLDEQLIDELKQIYSEQMIIKEKGDMNYQLLGTTGMKLLDAQLQHYILECTQKGIQLDTFITEPIGRRMQQLELEQLKLQTLIGDLLRNAVKAIERSRNSSGKILFVIGVKENSLEIDIFDNGMEFSLHVLEHFGQRGITTGGTGNGLADMVELLTEHQASLLIRENEADKSAYRKGIMIIFDGQNRRELISYRDLKQLKSKESIWNIKTETTES